MQLWANITQKLLMLFNLAFLVKCKLYRRKVTFTGESCKIRPMLGTFDL